MALSNYFPLRVIEGEPFHDETASGLILYKVKLDRHVMLFFSFCVVFHRLITQRVINYRQFNES